MKKVIVSLVLCGGITVGILSERIVYADDTLNGSTEVGAEVIKGDVTLAMDSATDFGSQPLSETVDFGAKDINYTVTDYSGTTDGFTISAKLTDTDDTRSLKIGETELSETAAAVITKDSNEVGDNTDKISATLVYTGVTKVQKYATTIEWNVTKASINKISE